MKPQPEAMNVVCKACGLAWDDHQPDKRGNVQLSECVRLLKAELAKPRAHVYWGNSISSWSSPSNVTYTIN